MYVKNLSEEDFFNERIDLFDLIGGLWPYGEEDYLNWKTLCTSVWKFCCTKLLFKRPWSLHIFWQRRRNPSFLLWLFAKDCAQPIV
jgi:hypothetical protein